MIEAPGSTYMPADEKSCWQSSLNAFEAVVVIAVCSTISATDGPISPVGRGAALPTSVAAASRWTPPTRMRKRTIVGRAEVKAGAGNPSGVGFLSGCKGGGQGRH